jgi:membrane associated rhomboid family serine protease
MCHPDKKFSEVKKGWENMRQNNGGMSNFERKFGRYAIPNLSLILVMCYVAGYIIDLVNPVFMNYLTLDPYQILHGQIWRVFTWIISPPSDLDIFTLIMLIFYYSIGTSLERTWGTYRYNVYIFGGMLITVVASILCMGVCYLLFPELRVASVAVSFFAAAAGMFSTYYINMSIFLAYAATYPDNQVLLMFVIPVKVKWLGILYAVLLLINMAQSFMYGLLYHPAYWFSMVAIAASLVNFLIFWLTGRRMSYLRPKQIKRKVQFKHQVREGERKSGHRCCICGQTDADDPTLEFRYCSKCVGNYEYCQHHLFTHEHKV